MRDNVKRKLDRRKQHAKKHENSVQGTCVDCGQPCLLTDIFMVRSATWAEAGLNGWDAGHFHPACFEKRVGRKLNKDELLVWNVGGENFKVHPDYLNTPEFLEHRPRGGIAGT
jgi:hypothetical protein